MSTTKHDRAVRLQVAALPYRTSKSEGLQVMLITSRSRQRWIVPKGWPTKNLSPAETAAREASEEAGISGKIARRSIGAFRYEKLLDAEDGAIPCEVKVFSLRVKRQAKAWPEQHERETRWFDAEHAAALAADDDLRVIIEAFSARLSK